MAIGKYKGTFLHHMMRLLGILTLLSQAMAVHADTAIRDYYAEPGLHPYKGAANDILNEHIDPFSGTLQIKSTDILIPGNGGMDIAINRVYTSQQIDSLPNQSTYGVGWTIHFGRVLANEDMVERACNQRNFQVHTGDNPTLEMPDGGREVLIYNTTENNNTFITRGQWRASCSTAGNGGFIVTSPNGTRYTMDQFANEGQGTVSWYTTHIEDVHGNAIAINYLFNPMGLLYID